MNRQAINSLTSICKILNEEKVQYLMIGGFAVALYGYTRMSTDDFGNQSLIHDFDIWYNPTYDNYFNLLNALEKLGHDVEAFKKEQTPNPRKSFFKFTTPFFTLDFLPTLKGIDKFHNAYINRQTKVVDKIEISLISLDDLMLNKLIIGRKKDLEDIIQLKKIKNIK